MKNKTKFDELSRDELLKACLELEDENATLRPKPARFKQGQLVAYTGARNPWMREQPAIYFTVLSTECNNGLWFYGHSKSGPQSWHLYPEKKCRELTEAELKGSIVPVVAPQAMEASAPGLGSGINVVDDMHQDLAHSY